MEMLFCEHFERDLLNINLSDKYFEQTLWTKVKGTFYNQYILSISLISPTLNSISASCCGSIWVLLIASVSEHNVNSERNSWNGSTSKQHVIYSWITVVCIDACTCYCYGVISYKASHALRPFSDVLCVTIWAIIIPDSFTSALWLQHKHLLANQGVGEKFLKFSWRSISVILLKVL
jgi:uncharacterized membrane protein